MEENKIQKKMNINQKIRETKKTIVQNLNNAELPIQVLRLIIAEIYNIINNQSTQEAMIEE